MSCIAIAALKRLPQVILFMRGNLDNETFLNYTDILLADLNNMLPAV